jgi:RNA polymerase sigma-70 factor (ECF subfamily)
MTGGVNMTDNKILDLYEARSESAISETAKQYGTYCTTIAMRILQNNEDSEEIVNDTYLKAWNAIPPQRPPVFSAFLGRITKNLSLDKHKARKTQKRGGNEIALLLSEIEEFVSSGYNLEKEVDSKVFKELIEKFLFSIEKNDRLIFVRRYWFNDSITAISERYDMSESKVKSSLFRTRKKLKTHLEKEGVHYE